MTDANPQDVARTVLSLADRQALAGAVESLENSTFAVRIADYAGAPLNKVLRLLPRAASARFSRSVELAIHKSLKVAINSLDEEPKGPPANWISSTIAGITGGVSGLIGAAALPVELPLTTTLILRAIAEIARHNGEDLNRLEARVACLQVFALGARRKGARTDVGYFAARTLLTRFTSNASAFLLERGAAEVSGPIINRLVTEIASRFSIVVSDRIAASAVPIIGAIGGATVNVIFMNHFQEIAEGHFTVRRLERQYGASVVHEEYTALAAKRAQERK